MISAVILTKNEEVQIVDCIESVDFCDEIVIVDDNSDDKTPEIIKRLNNPKVKFIQHPLKNFASQRNKALTHVTQPWTLFVDADERITVDLKTEIIRSVVQEQHVAYEFKRHDCMWGKTLSHGEIGDVRLLRLARTEIGKGKWKGAVHERWEIIGSVGQFQQPLIHHPHQSVRDFLSDIDTYSSLRAYELYTSGTSTNWFTIVGYPVTKFMVNYFWKRGYRDGIPGLVTAVMMSFHSFLVRAKLYQLRFSSH